VDRAAIVGQDTDRDGNDARYNLLSRGRRNIAVDLKNPAGVDAALRLIERADALLEGFRPGVMERLGLGPDLCLTRNPKLVDGRGIGVLNDDDVWRARLGRLAGRARREPHRWRRALLPRV